MEKEQAHCSIDLETLSSGDKNVKVENGGVCTVQLTEKALITDQVGSRQGCSSRKMKNAFELFNQKIWEMMIDGMDDSKDIVSVLRGIPQLDISVESSIKRFWYIGAILPHLFDFIGQKDVLNLRLVCKDWQRRVDNFLPNQPYFRAYSEKLHKDSPEFWKFIEVWISEDEDGEYIRNLYSNTFREGGPFISADTADCDCINDTKILKEALEHPRNRNPFVFRKLDLYLHDNNDDGGNWKALLLQRMLSFLEQLGSRFWNLSIFLGLSRNMLEITSLIKMLEFAPSLKCLDLYIITDVIENATAIKKSLPELPFLESLKIRGDWVQIAHEVSAGLIMRYGTQIRRLQLPLNHWKPEFKEMFPQLTELGLYFCYSGSYAHKCDISTFQNLLLTISAPNLVKITFLVVPPEEIAFSFQRDILKWLKRFPKIKYFEIKCETSINEFEDKLLLPGDPIKDCIPSLQTLKIVDGHGLSYDFLRCFPALRHLELQCFCRPTVVDFSIPDTSIKLREQLQTAKLYESNIWEFLPKLRTISLVAGKIEKHKDYSCYNFSRDTYEKMKKFGKIPLEPQLHVYRKDIQYFVRDEEDEPTDSEDSSDDVDVGLCLSDDSDQEWGRRNYY